MVSISGGPRISRCGEGRRPTMKMCVKMKELGPVGGVHRAHPLDPPMSIVEDVNKKKIRDVH